MRRSNVGKKCLVLVIFYNYPKNYNYPEQVYNDNNERTSKMMQEAVKHTLLRDGKILVMGILMETSF